MSDIKLKSLTGVTGFLNGQEGLHSREEEMSDILIKMGKKVIVIDNLFKEPDKLLKIVKCNNIVLSTTGLFADKLHPLIKTFEKLKYAPKKVIFMGENTAMYFLGNARLLKKKGTKFYYPYILDGLAEIEWI